jgi:hypothetical protein
VPHKDREVRNAYARDWYAKNKEAHLLLVRRNRWGSRKLVAEYLAGLKSQPCTDCGGTFDPEAMDFDHVTGVKLFNVSAASSAGYSLKKIEDEVAKCELVCAVCHRIRTKRRREAAA